MQFSYRRLQRDMIDEGDIPSIHCKMSLRGPKSMRKVDDLSLIFIDYYVPALTIASSSPCIVAYVSIVAETFIEPLPRNGSCDHVTIFSQTQK
jgi:hypothetical protein